jgi:hypothetical protein
VVKPVPVTTSVVFPPPRETVDGETEVMVGAGFTIVSAADAHAVEVPLAVAVTVTALGEGSEFGAV